MDYSTAAAACYILQQKEWSWPKCCSRALVSGSFAVEKIIFSSSIRFLRRSSITRWHSMCTMVIRALRSSFSRVVEILRTPDSSPFNPYQNSDRSIPISLMKNFRDEEVVCSSTTSSVHDANEDQRERKNPLGTVVSNFFLIRKKCTSKSLALYSF